MEKQLSLLIQLQEIDTQIRSLAEQKNKLPEIVASLERQRTASREELEKIREGLQTAQKNKRERDKDLEAGAQKVEKLKARTSEIKNNKEYQALLKEIEAGEQENKVIEDEILVLMEKIDAAAAAITEAEKKTEETNAAISAEQKEHEAEIEKIDEALKSAQQQQEKIAAGVEPSLLTRYQGLLASKAGSAIAEARSESCSGCYMSIPPQVFVNVKKNESIIACPHCNRILYYKEAIIQANS